MLEVFHEATHGWRREARARDRLTRADDLAILRAADAVLAGKTTRREKTQLRFLPENYDSLTAEQQETLLDEGISKLIEAEVLRTRKTGGALDLPPGLVSRNLAAFARIAGKESTGRFRSFVNAVRQHFGLALDRAHHIDQGLKDGRIDPENYEAYVNKLLGLREDAAGEAGSGRLEGISDGMAFSLSREDAVRIRGEIDAQIPIEISTKEIPAALKAKDAIQWATSQGVVGETSHPGIGRIEIRPRGVKNALGHLLNPRKMAALLKMKELIPRSTILHLHRRESASDSYRLAGRITIDGKEYITRIIIDTDANGNRFYNHELSDLAELAITRSPQAPIPGVEPTAQQIGVEELEDTRKLLQWIYGVNSLSSPASTTAETHTAGQNSPETAEGIPDGPANSLGDGDRSSSPAPRALPEIGKLLNSQKSKIPKSPGHIPYLLRRIPMDQWVDYVTQWLGKAATVMDPDGETVLLANPEKGSLSRRARHLLGSFAKEDTHHRDGRELRVDKGRTVFSIPRTIQDYQVKAEDGKGTLAYIRHYEDGTLHMVLVEKATGKLQSHGLITQRALDPKTGAEGLTVQKVRASSALSPSSPAPGKTGADREATPGMRPADQQGFTPPERTQEDLRTPENGSQPDSGTGPDAGPQFSISSDNRGPILPESTGTGPALSFLTESPTGQRAAKLLAQGGIEHLPEAERFGNADVRRYGGDSRREILEAVWNMANSSYARIGGHPFTGRPMHSMLEPDTVFDVMFEDGVPVAFSIEKPTVEGLKCTLTGTDGSLEGKIAWRRNFTKFQQPGFYIEASGAVEKHALEQRIPIVPVREAGRVLDKVVTPGSDGGHYQRNITVSGLSEPHTKIIFGIPWSLKNTETPTSLPISSTSSQTPAGPRAPSQESSTSRSNPSDENSPSKNASTDAPRTRRNREEVSSEEAESSNGTATKSAVSALDTRRGAEAISSGEDHNGRSRSTGQDQDAATSSLQSQVDKESSYSYEHSQATDLPESARDSGSANRPNGGADQDTTEQESEAKSQEKPAIDPNDFTVRDFDSPLGPIEIGAAVEIDGDTIILRGLAFYAKGQKKVDLGLREVIRIRDLLADEARDLGYKSLRITGLRLSGARPGKFVDSTMDLTKQRK